MPVDAVIFDVGNVLIEWQPERFYDRTIGEARRRKMFAELDLHGMNEDIDRGAPFKETIYNWADQNPGWQDEIRMWHDNWFELASPTIDHSVRLLRALRSRGIPVFALSNFGIQNWPPAVQVYPFMGEFDREYVSGRMGVTKPAPQIYEMVEQDCSIAPDRLLFTDDRQENIDSAVARGWQTHHFQGAKGWAQCLVNKGLLTPQEAT